MNSPMQQQQQLEWRRTKVLKELLTNATVVDDAIRFVASNAANTTDKASYDKTVVVDKEYHSHKKQDSIVTTNSIF